MRVCPHPIALPFYFCLAGRFLNLGWARGLGQASSKKKRRNSNAKSKTLSRADYTISIFPWLRKVFEVHPRHPPRAFPLELRVPRCLCAGKQNLKRLKYQEMSRLEFARSSWGEEVSSPRVGTTLSDYRECSTLAIPTLRFSILCLVCSFRCED